MHESFRLSTGEEVPLDGQRKRAWFEFLRSGFTDEDMKRVLHFLRKNMEPDGIYKPQSVMFRTLICDLDKFRERLALAKGASAAETPAKLPTAASYGIE